MEATGLDDLPQKLHEIIRLVINMGLIPGLSGIHQDRFQAQLMWHV